MSCWPQKWPQFSILACQLWYFWWKVLQGGNQSHNAIKKSLKASMPFLGAHSVSRCQLCSSYSGMLESLPTRPNSGRRNQIRTFGYPKATILFLLGQYQIWSLKLKPMNSWAFSWPSSEASLCLLQWLSPALERPLSGLHSWLGKGSVVW